MPSSFEKEHRRELLLLDTGPIRELVLFHAVHKLGFETLRSELKFVKDRRFYDNCGDFIASYRKKTTSASVVAELHHWIRKTERTGQERLWNRVYEEFESMEMDEEVVRLLDMDARLVASFGPVDVSLLKLALRNADQNPLLLTIDSDLRNECTEAGINASLLGEVGLMVR